MRKHFVDQNNSLKVGKCQFDRPPYSYCTRILPLPPFLCPLPIKSVPMQVATPVPGKWRVALDSDAHCFGGRGRIGHDVDHFTIPSEGVFHDR